MGKSAAIVNELQPWNRISMGGKAAVTEYSLDFINSDSLNDVEEGIRETARGIDTANLAVALAIARIDREALYAQAGYKSYQQYLKEAENRINLPASTISEYKKIGETYTQYRSHLQKIGFEEKGNLHKLRFLEKALETHNKKEVFDRLKNDTFRNFKAFAINHNTFERSKENLEPAYQPQIEISAKRIKIDGKNILKLDPDLEETTREEIGDYLREVYRIRAAGNKPLVVEVYDDGEIRAVSNFLKRHRVKK